MSLILTLLASVVGLLLGSLTHETAHYLTARAAGVRARVGLVMGGVMPRPETRYDIPGRRADQAIRYAPLLSGLIAAVAWAILEGRVPAWPVLAWWVSHTLAGGAADYRPGDEAVSVPVPDQRQTELAFLAIATAGLYATWGLYTVGVGLPTPLWYAVFTLCVGVAMGFGLVGALRVTDRTEVHPQ